MANIMNVNYKNAAMEVLSFNKQSPESMFHIIPHSSNSITMKGKDDTAWIFTTRRRCHLYLMAKTPTMAQYTTIYKKD